MYNSPLRMVLKKGANIWGILLTKIQSLWTRLVFVGRSRLDEHYTRFACYLQVLCVGGCLLYFRTGIHVPIGLAIGLLAAIAVVISIRAVQVETFKITERVAWIVIGFMLFYVEIQSIYWDRDEHERQQEAALTYERDQFRTIFEQNQRQFDETLLRMSGLAASGQKAISISTETIDQITGGDSWISIAPTRSGTPFSDFVVFVEGKHPFYGETLEVYDSNGLHRRRPTFPFPAPEGLVTVIPLPTYYPGWARPLHFSVPITNERAQMFEFRIIGKYGKIQEWIKVSLSNGSWQTSGEVHRGKKLLGKWTDPGFPKDWKLEVPSLPLDPKLDPTPYPSPH